MIKMLQRVMVRPSKLEYYSIVRFSMDDVYYNKDAYWNAEKSRNKALLAGTFNEYIVSPHIDGLSAENFFDISGETYKVFENLKKAHEGYLELLIDTNEAFAIPSRFLRETVTDFFPRYVDASEFKEKLEASGLSLNLGR